MVLKTFFLEQICAWHLVHMSYPNKKAHNVSYCEQGQNTLLLMFVHYKHVEKIELSERVVQFIFQVSSRSINIQKYLIFPVCSITAHSEDHLSSLTLEQ